MRLAGWRAMLHLRYLLPRTAIDLPQEALAERTGCAVQTIRKIEAGERRPSPPMAYRAGPE